MCVCVLSLSLFTVQSLTRVSVCLARAPGGWRARPGGAPAGRGRAARGARQRENAKTATTLRATSPNENQYQTTQKIKSDERDQHQAKSDILSYVFKDAHFIFFHTS